MGFFGFAVGVEFFLEQFVDGLVDIKRRRVGPSDLEAGIKPKTAWALHKKLDF